MLSMRHVSFFFDTPVKSAIARNYRSFNRAGGLHGLHGLGFLARRAQGKTLLSLARFARGAGNTEGYYCVLRELAINGGGCYLLTLLRTPGEGIEQSA